MAATEIINLDIKSKQQSIKYNMAATDIINLTKIKSESRFGIVRQHQYKVQ
jgi:hypothetical protein